LPDSPWSFGTLGRSRQMIPHNQQQRYDRRFILEFTAVCSEPIVPIRGRAAWRTVAGPRAPNMLVRRPDCLGTVVAIDRQASGRLRRPVGTQRSME
jgi:hypothetical protein